MERREHRYPSGSRTPPRGQRFGQAVHRAPRDHHRENNLEPSPNRRSPRRRLRAPRGGNRSRDRHHRIGIANVAATQKATAHRREKRRALARRPQIEKTGEDTFLAGFLRNVLRETRCAATLPRYAPLDARAALAGLRRLAEIEHQLLNRGVLRIDGDLLHIFDRP